MKLTKAQRARVRKAVQKAIAQTKARQRRRDDLWHEFLKTIHIPLT